MFDRRIYTNDPKITHEINKDNCFLNIVNVINIAICVALLLFQVLSENYKAINISWDIAISLILVYLVTWVYSLCALFAKFKASNRLLPNKKMFIIHGVLLAFYSLFNVIGQLSLYVPRFRNQCGENCYYICYGIDNMASACANITEQIMFVFVVYSYIPLTGSQKAQTEKLRNVFL